jgi:hypothetical protein
VFLDPPNRGFTDVYGSASVADEVEAWAGANPKIRIALAGHVGDYPSLSAWDCVQWTRPRFTYGGSKTTALEALWFSPACIQQQRGLFDAT